MDSRQNKRGGLYLVWKLAVDIPEIIAGIVLSVTSVLVFLTVIFRYFLHMPLGWTEEMSRLLFLWIVFLGAAVCAGQERHTRFDMFVKKRAPLTRKILDVISCVLILVITGVMIYQGFVAYRLIFFERFVILGIPYAFGFMALPFGAILIFIYYCHHLWVKMGHIFIIHETGRWVEGGNRESH